MSDFQASTFPTTQWTLVQLLHSPDVSKAEIALDLLCQAYYRPLYSYARSGGLSPHDAEDAVQDFFVHVLGNDSLKTLQQQKGSVRGWIKQAFNNKLHKSRASKLTQKRGGRWPHLSLDFDLAEKLFSRHHSPDSDPAHACDLTEALQLWEQTLARLESDPKIQKRPEIYAALRPHLLQGWTPEGLTQAQLGQSLGLTANALKVRLSNLIAKTRSIFAEVAQDTMDPLITKEEVEYLWCLAKTHGKASD